MTQTIEEAKAVCISEGCLFNEKLITLPLKIVWAVEGRLTEALLFLMSNGYEIDRLERRIDSHDGSFTYPEEFAEGIIKAINDTGVITSPYTGPVLYVGSDPATGEDFTSKLSVDSSGTVYEVSTDEEAVEALKHYLSLPDLPNNPEESALIERTPNVEPPFFTG